jgi:hypothetical protein
MGPGLTSSRKAPSEAFAVGCGESLGAPRWPGLLTTRATGQVPSDHQLYLNTSSLLQHLEHHHCFLFSPLSAHMILLVDIQTIC